MNESICIKVKSCSILLTRGTDRISFVTDLPTAFPEIQYPVVLDMEARANFGQTWLSENFPNLIPEIINSR